MARWVPPFRVEEPSPKSWRICDAEDYVVCKVNHVGAQETDATMIAYALNNCFYVLAEFQELTLRE